jgi:hypothetical protein
VIVAADEELDDIAAPIGEIDEPELDLADVELED